MSHLKSQIESILMVTSKPITIKKLAETIKAKPQEVKELISELGQEYQEQGRGYRLLINNDKVQIVSSAENSQLVKEYLKDDITGELTDPSLETLTIVAYRQPVSKAELEQIRGVNCSLILRNLLIRGLIEAEYSSEKATTVYSVTLDFLKYLGLNNIQELPDYEKLNSHDNLQKLLNQSAEQTEANQDQLIKIEVKKINNGSKE